MDASAVEPVMAQTVLKAVTDAAVEPQKFFMETNSALADSCEQAVKELFDLAKRVEPTQLKFGPLPELLVAGFTEDQIWEQIELYNTPLQRYVTRSVPQTPN